MRASAVKDDSLSLHVSVFTIVFVLCGSAVTVPRQIEASRVESSCLFLPPSSSDSDPGDLSEYFFFTTLVNSYCMSCLLSRHSWSLEDDFGANMRLMFFTVVLFLSSFIPFKFIFRV